MRRLRAVAVVACLGLTAFWVTVIAGASRATISTAFTSIVVVLLVAVWWAAARARANLRSFIRLAAWAVSFQTVGSVLWVIAFEHNGRHAPAPPGYWTPFLYVALALGAAAAWAAVRDVVRIREATLDYSVVLAAGACLAVAAIGAQFESGLSTAAALDAAARPVAGVLIVVIVVSAALGNWQTLPLPVGLFAASQVFNAAGNLLFGTLAAEGAYDNRWTDSLWLTSAVLAIVAATAVALRIDRPLREPRADTLPAVSARELMLAAMAAWSCCTAVTLYGALGDHPTALVSGLAASVWIGLAVPLRTLLALQESRDAYRRLDQAHFALERAGDRAAELGRQRDETLQQLERRNVEYRAVQAMLGPLLEIADERSDGQLRARLEETADDLTAWLPDQHHDAER